MNYYVKLAIEAIIVGIGVVVIGSLISYFVGVWYPRPSLPSECSTYNKYHIMEFTLFLTGVLFHLLCEVTGLNIWYLKNAAAKMKKR